MKEDSQANMDFSSDSHHAFAVDLYREVRQQKGNLFLSPFSIRECLHMAYLGSCGNTRAQMADILRLDPPPELGISHNHANPRQAIGAQLFVANALWAQRGFNLLPRYLAKVQEESRGECNEADFANAPLKACRAINKWVAKQTREMIPWILEEVKSSTLLVLANAVYFKGHWASQFEKRLTQMAEFHRDAKGIAKPIETGTSGLREALEMLREQEAVPVEKQVSLMHQTGRFHYFEDDEFRALELPYGDRTRPGSVSMVIFLPRKYEGLDEFEQSMTASRLATWLAGLESEKNKREVQVYLPRFELTWRSDQMVKTLRTLGITDAFDGEADFSGMTGRKGLCITRVVHEAKVRVAEEGTEAAAATVAEMTLGWEPLPVFRADHPFFFLIRDKRSGSILFMGRLTDTRRIEGSLAF